MGFKYVSLFSGIGGFEQGLNPFGGECVMASEIDKWANMAYEILYGHKTVGDITKVEAKDVPDHDLLCGGYPCQSFSVAGRQRGFDDIRGTLFFEIARIAKEKQPKVLFLENVKNLVSHDKGRTLDVMLHTLNDIGYTVDFTVLNSKHYNVPQNRERIYIIALRDDLITPEPWIIKGNDVVAKGKKRFSEYEGIKTFNFDWPTNDTVGVRLRDILEDDVDEKYYLSKEKAGKLIAQLEQRGMPKLPSEEEIHVVGRVEVNGHDLLKRCYDPSGISPCIETMGGGNREPKIVIVGNLKPEHCTRKGQRDEVYSDEGLMGTLNATDYKQPRLISEEVRPVLTPDRMEKRQNGRRFKNDGEEAFTLTAQDIHGVAIGKYPKYRIRKITPKECFRLQSFKDEDFDRLVESGISNTQLYKMAGNAVTVNVISAVCQKLIKYL